MTSFVLENTARSALADAFTTLLGAAATIEFQTAANAEVATISFNNPAFGSAVNGVITADVDPALSDTNATGNASPMTKFLLKTGGTTLQATGDVAVSSATINFSGGVTVGAGDTVTLTSFTVTVPAGT